MSAIDTVIALRIIHLLVQPFDQWPAYQSGIIDKDGKLLITDTNKMTQAQHEDWTMLQRLVWRLKLLLAKIPAGKTQFASYAAAYLLVREHYQDTKDMNDLYEQLQKKISQVTPADIALVEEMGAGVVGSGPTNSVSAVMPQTKDLPEILNKKKMIRRFKDYRKEKVNGNS